MTDRTVEALLPSALTRYLEAPGRRFEFDVATGMRGHPVHAPGASFDGSATTRSIIVEGWRFLAHSYAIVNQWQLLALSRRPDVAPKVIDLPFHGRRWKSQDDLWEPADENLLRSLQTADPAEPADVTLRVAFPLDFSPSRSGLTVIFGTSESQVIPKEALPDSEAYERLRRAPPPQEVRVLTPSHWSAQGFFNAGLETEQVLVIPHGVDVATFHPMAELRGRIRRSIDIAADDFVFFSAGAMSGNKGVDLLLQAFAQVCKKFPHAKLVLKGMDALYKSRSMLIQNLLTVPEKDRQRVLDRLIYFGESLPFRKMALLYQAADVYVSAYRAEGFNMPVLEAAACGIPVICTRGGATDDFVTDAFARRIDSRKITIGRKDEYRVRLEPDLEHLVAQMISAIEDHSWRMRAAEAGPRHVHHKYTWDDVVGTLIHKLFN